MTTLEVARIAANTWPRDLAVTMIAIAGAESNWNPAAGGDSPATLRRLGYYDSAEAARSFNCPPGDEYGPASWGLWQIFMPYHRDKLRALGAPADDPCRLAAWLKDPANNAAAADAILRSQGLEAWTTYRTGAWLRYKAEAEQATEDVLREQPRRSPSLALWWTVLPAAASLLLAGTYIYLKERQASG